MKTIALRTSWLLAVLAASLAGSPMRARASDLSAFLDRAEQMALFNRPVRADIKVTRATSWWTPPC